MMKPNNSTQEGNINMNWMRVMDLGVGAVIEKASYQSHKAQNIQVAVFIVMP